MMKKKCKLSAVDTMLIKELLKLNTNYYKDKIVIIDNIAKISRKNNVSRQALYNSIRKLEKIGYIKNLNNNVYLIELDENKIENIIKGANKND